jgi:hypothetical protein
MDSKFLSQKRTEAIDNAAALFAFNSKNLFDYKEFLELSVEHDDLAERQSAILAHCKIIKHKDPRSYNEMFLAYDKTTGKLIGMFHLTSTVFSTVDGQSIETLFIRRLYLLGNNIKNGAIRLLFLNLIVKTAKDAGCKKLMSLDMNCHNTLAVGEVIKYPKPQRAPYEFYIDID